MLPNTHLHANNLIRCLEVDRWEPIDVHDILQDHNHIFDSADPGTRQPINNLIDYPMFDDIGREKRIYDSHGDQILRKLPILKEDEYGENPDCPLLLKLKSIPQFFQEPLASLNASDSDQGSDNEDAAIRPPSAYNEPMKCMLFPQAYLKLYGQVQTDRVSPHFCQKIKHINQVIGASIPAFHSPSLSDDEEDEVPAFYTPLQPDSCQMYNAIAHKLMMRAGSLDAMQGDITNAMAGSYASTPAAQRRGRKAFEACQQNLPQDRISRRILPDNGCKALRVENVYVMNIQQVKPVFQSGACVSSSYGYFSMET